MTYKTIEARRRHYQLNKDKINAKRREYDSRPEIKLRKKIREKEWREKNKDKVKKRNKLYKKKYDTKIKNLVFDHYGKTCACCGEKQIEFLSIDHIKGNGTKHRKSINNHLYIWLYKNNFPKGFQTLCFNCNWGKHINGICPHKTSK